MLSHKKSLNILKKTKALIDGHFVLSSGLHSSKYIQCAKLLSHPKQAKIICSSLCEKIKKKFNNIDMVLSPALWGVVVGYEIGRQLDVESIFAERVDNKLTLRRNFKIKEKSNVLIVEDVITTGKSALECANLVKISEANLLGYACIIDRSDKKNLLIKNKKIISQIKISISSYKKNSLPSHLKKIPITMPGSRFLK